MPSKPTVLAAGVVAGAAGARSRLAGPAAFARMSGWSIATPGAAGWITDFLNAAYYRRAPDARTLDDLRLAFAVVTTRWNALGGRRLRSADVLAFHRAFGRDRLTARGGSPRGTLDREQLLEGAARLLGDWFPDAYADDDRRGWSIAFPSAEARAAHRPERRLAVSRLGAQTPETAPPEQQTWHTYPAVATALPAERIVAALARPERWPDYASETGRFTPLRPGGLPGQTFEIEVAAGTAAGRPLFVRGYVTVTRCSDGSDPGAREAHFREVAVGFERYGHGHQPLPAGHEPVLALDLTTHHGHFMGAGHNRLLVYRHEGRTCLRAAGTWDPMPWHLDQAYRRAGRDAQRAFWGEGDVTRQSMLHQLLARLGD